jgi:hypothetical protein
MLFKEIISVYSEYNTKAIITKAALLTAKAGGTYSYHSVLEGNALKTKLAETIFNRMERCGLIRTAIQHRGVSTWVLCKFRVMKVPHSSKFI